MSSKNKQQQDHTGGGGSIASSPTEGEDRRARGKFLAVFAGSPAENFQTKRSWG
jgi:hypothetical protein